MLAQPTKHKGNFGASSTRCQQFVNIVSTCCAVAEGRPAWALAAARLREVAEGHQGHTAVGMPKHAGRARLGGLRRAKTLCGRFKMVAWPRAGLLCKEGQTEHGVGISAWSTAVSVSFDSTY